MKKYIVYCYILTPCDRFHLEWNEFKNQEDAEKFINIRKSEGFKPWLDVEEE